MQRGNAKKAAKQVYDDLARSGFSGTTLDGLLDSQYFEDELWPVWQTSTEKEVGLLICFILESKRKYGVPTLQALPRSLPDTQDERISKLVQLVLSASLDEGFSFRVRSTCLSFLIDAVLNLDVPLVQRAIQPIVSILIWRNILPAFRKEMFAGTAVLKKRYRSRTKALENAQGEEKTWLTIESAFLSNLVVDVIQQLHTMRNDAETIQYCARALSLFNILLSQFPTRRYTFYLLHDHQLVCNVKQSPRYRTKSQTSLTELEAQCQMLEHYMSISYDNINGKSLNSQEYQNALDTKVTRLQRLAFTEFKDKLLLLALSNHSSITDPVELHEHLKDLSEDDLVNLCDKLNIRTTWNMSTVPKPDGKLLRAYLAHYFKKTDSLQSLSKDQNMLPTEADLYNPYWTMLAQKADHLPLPNLTLQYLSYEDFLHRSTQIQQASTFMSIRSAISNTLSRLEPQILYPSRDIRFNGSSINALSISAPSIVEVAPRELSSSFPAFIRAEVRLNFEDVSAGIRASWHSLKKGDVLFFVHLEASDETSHGVPDTNDPEFASKIGIRAIRSAIIDAVLNADGKPLHISADGSNSGDTVIRSNRLVRVMFDRRAYQEDTNEGRLEEIYDNLNLVIKRKMRIKTPAKVKDEPIPVWMRDAFLGYGNAALADVQDTINVYDSFIDLEHAQEYIGHNVSAAGTEGARTSMTTDDYNKMTVANLKNMLIQEHGLSGTGKKAELIARLLEHDAQESEPSSKEQGKRMSYFSLKTSKSTNEESRKRKRDQLHAETFELNASDVPWTSPYMHSSRKRNLTRYTKVQMQAIVAAMTPGLTLVDGPAGSGKSSLLAQMVSNIYHNEIEARTIVVCKSEDVLDNITALLNALDIKSTHVLRLYASYESSPDVGNVLARRSELLSEVSRLALALNQPGDHGSSCETAAYFYSTVVQPKISAFAVKGNEELKTFFANAAHDESIPSQDYNLACKAYIDNIFSELAEIRPIELLRTAKSRQQYLLTKLSKIVLMSVDYAIANEQYLIDAKTGFTTIVLHQASVLSETESTLPFNFIKDTSLVRRLILTGDTQQLRPKQALLANVRISTNADQSLFSRFVRTGVETIVLSEQFNTRPQIANIYRDRYASLTPVATIDSFPANAGLAHVAQFINVSSYKGQGETSPRVDVWQNLGEAEYIVALYQYMRLLNYPKEKITILTPFEGQKALIQEVLGTRCKRSPIFGLPNLYTVDEYHGQKNDYVLLSLVRTSSNTDLQDANMLTTAMSRATKGLYVFGRLSAMPAICHPFLRHLNVAGEGQLELLTGEMFPTTRKTEDVVPNVAVMAGVEHLGQYVYEMTQKRLGAMTS